MTKSFRFSCRVAISFVVVVGTLFPGCTPSPERAPTEANQPPIEEGYFPGADGVRLIIPRETGHRIKDHIMTVIQDEVLDGKSTKNIQ